MDIDLIRSCRSCLRQTNDMHPICESAKCYKNVDFDVKESYMWNISIAEVIMACTIVNISPDDGFPQSVCSQCLHQIQQAFHFKEMCEAADTKLRQFSPNKTDPISCIKTENNETINVFQPETVLVTEFSPDAEFENEPDTVNIVDVLKIKQEKKQREEKMVTQIKIERLPSDVDEQTLVEQAQIVDGRYQCEFCKKSLADRRTYKLHIRLHTGENLKRCPVCDRGFSKKNHLDRHMLTHEKTPKTIKSNKAPESTKSNSKEVKDEEETISSIQLCDSKRGILHQTEEERGRDENENSERMAQRKNKTNTNKNVDNTGCETKVIPLDEEEQRLVNSAKKVCDRYECPICLKTLAQRKILELHIRTHIGKNLHRCSVCDKGFAKRSNLNRHMLLHDNENNIRLDETISKSEQPDGSFCCPLCMKIFTQRQSLRFHLRLHTRNCSICNQSFATDEQLLEHMPVHGDCFSCIECDEVFKTFKDRRDHTETVHATKKLSREKKPRPPKDASDDDDDDEDEQLVNSAELVDGRYKCKFCEKTLANRGTLKLHIRLHLQKKLKICEQCGNGFSKKSHLDRHMKTHMPKKPECKFCHATFESIQEKKEHTVAAHKDETLKVRTAVVPWTQPNGKKVCQCMICDTVFESIATLRNHLSWHTNTMKWIREVDLKSKKEYLQTFNEFKDGEFTNEEIANILQTKLKNNSVEVSKMYRATNACGWELSLTDSETESESDDINEGKRAYDCIECPRSYDRLYKLICHTKGDHTISRKFQCTHCLQCFPNQTVLAKHLRQQCENQSKTVHCKMCYARFTWQSSLETHFAAYHSSESNILSTGFRPHKCVQCPKSFYTEEQLNDHLLRHLPREKRFSCEICAKRFSRFDNMSTHMRSHIPPHERETIAKTHLCSYCGQSFANSSNLNVHIRKHTGERPFKCDFCSSRFHRSCDLSCHRRTHTGEKPFSCLVCGKSFSRSNKLSRHMRIHTGERPYKCTECDRSFTQSNDLTLHLRRHSGAKPFGCICGERFITNSLLKQHRRTQGHMQIDEATGLI